MFIVKYFPNSRTNISERSHYIFPTVTLKLKSLQPLNVTSSTHWRELTSAKHSFGVCYHNQEISYSLNLIIPLSLKGWIHEMNLNFTMLLSFIFTFILRRFFFRSGNVEHPSDKFYNTTVEVKPVEQNHYVSMLNTTSDGFIVVGKC